MGFKISISLLFFSVLLYSRYQWTETTQEDFADGIYEKNIYASLRDGGMVEFVPRYDLNNDGYLDIWIFGRLTGCIYLYWGSDGGYSLTNRTVYPIGGTGGNCDAADINFDGYPDFVCAPLENGFAYIYWGTDSGPSLTDTTCLAIPSNWNESSFLADLNKDGYLDIIVGNTVDYFACIFWGSAGGYGTDMTLLPTQSAQFNIEVADLNQDTWLDIVLVNDYAAYNYIYWGSTSGFMPGNYQSLPTMGYGHGSSVADLNNDGYLDLIFTTRENDQANIYYGTSNGYSNYVVVSPGQGYGSAYGGSAVADLNEDEYLDIVFFTVGFPLIYYGSADGFADSLRDTIPVQTWTACGFVCDLGSDYSLDVLLGNWGWDGITQIAWGPRLDSTQSLGADYDHHGMFREIGNVYNRKYYENYISSVCDASSGADWQVVEWDDSLPPGSGIELSIRTGNTPAPDSIWSGFHTVINGDTLPDSLNSRYIQYQTHMVYTNPVYLPCLKEVRISYELLGIESDHPGVQLCVSIQPNPFTRKTRVDFYTCNQDNAVTMRIYDVTGRMVRKWTITDPHKGLNHVEWHGDDSNGNMLPKGVYFIEILNGMRKQDLKVTYVD